MFFILTTPAFTNSFVGIDSAIAKKIILFRS